MISTDDVFDLLPAVYRLRDAERDDVLRGLVEVLAAEADVLDRDIEELYDNWFVETCAPWLVTYIGDLLAVQPLHRIPGAVSERAYVANTIGYRRRKGTLGVLEQLAFDVTDWRAKAVEFFQLLGTTQFLNHTRPANLRTPDIRNVNALELLDGPFERTTHTAEVRRIERRRGRYNIPNVGLYLYRLQRYPMRRSTARAVADPEDGRYWFGPLPLDQSLFNNPRSDEGITDLAEELDVPAPLRRRALFDELEARRQALVDGRPFTPAYFGDRPVLQVRVKRAADAAATPIPPGQVLVADLSLWQHPPTTKDYRPAGSATPQPREIAVAVDPALGRITFPTATSGDIERVEVNYSYGFSTDLGGGPYERSSDAAFVRDADFRADVAAPQKLVDAIQAWNALPAGRAGVITITDSASYVEDLVGSDRIELKEGSELLLRAASEERPHLRGNISTVGTAGATSENPGRLTIEGLLVEGTVTVLVGNLGRLRLRDATVVPPGGVTVNASTTVGEQNAMLALELERTISGPLAVPLDVQTLSIRYGIVDGQSGGVAIAAPETQLAIDMSTLFGSTACRSIAASNSIFVGAVVAERRQAGCLRFCFVPLETSTRTPRRFRCQPDLALEGLTGAAEALVRARVAPTFTSTEYGRSGYAQLSTRCASEIRTGAEDGAEMGVFELLKQPQREANLRVALDEYLRFGLEAGVFYVT